MESRFYNAEKDPRNPEANAIRGEEALSTEEAVEKLRPGAVTLVEKNRNGIVEKVSALLREYKSPYAIPEEKCEELADLAGGYEPNMIRAVALEIGQKPPQNKPH